MSFVACGAGQAGNQILGLTARYMGPLTPPQQQPSVSSSSSGSSSSSRAAAVRQPGYTFVDSEPKVVRPLRTPGDPLHLPFATPECVVFDHNGRGNNWAWGYTGAANHRQPLGDGGGHLTSARGDTLAARALAAVRKQAEACDTFDSLMLVHSLGGGTGSGLGSRLLELVRDAYPTATLLSACVAPFSTGDTPLQWYNTVLTLATAHEVADGVLLFDNADLMARAGRLRAAGEALYPAHHHGTGGSSGAGRPASAGGGSPGGGSNARVSTTDLNSVVAQCLAGVLLPTRHRRRLPRAKRLAAGAGDDDDGGSAGADGRPAWVSIAPAAAAAEAGAFHNPYAEQEDDDDEGGDDFGAGAAALSQLVGRPLMPAPFDALAFVQDLVPAPAYKYIDVRSAAPLQGGAAAATSGGRLPALEPSAVAWTDLGGMIVDTLPRTDRGGRPVTTLAARLVARGASQADCDAVDPSLAALKDKGGSSAAAGGDRRAPAGGSGPGRPGRGGALPPPFSSRLSRAQAFSSALPPDRQRSARLTPGPVYTSPLAPLPQPRSLTLASNSTAHAHLLATAVSRVRLQASVGAYLHWYDRFGISAEHVAVAADSVADMVDAYGALAPTSVRR
jgi:hypothetical protein